jgi:hypothetical protein
MVVGGQLRFWTKGSSWKGLKGRFWGSNISMGRDAPGMGLLRSTADVLVRMC